MRKLLLINTSVFLFFILIFELILGNWRKNDLSINEIPNLIKDRQTTFNNVSGEGFTTYS